MPYKVIMYAICKNEFKHIDRGLKAHAEAEKIIIIDTGSTDGCYEKLLNYQLEMPQLYVEQKIGEPFDFGAAKDYALNVARKYETINTVYCCFDLDEFLQPGSINYLKNHWQSEYDVAEINAQVPADNGECFVTHKIHSNNPQGHGDRPVHEVLILKEPDESLNILSLPIIYIHEQDKTKPRDYLNILLHHLEQNSTDVLSLRYIIGEYTARGMFTEAYYGLNKLESIPGYKRGINQNQETSEDINGRLIYHLFLSSSEMEKVGYAEQIFWNMQLNKHGEEYYIEKIYNFLDTHKKNECLGQALMLPRLHHEGTEANIYQQLTLNYGTLGEYIKAALCAMNALKADPNNEALKFNLQECALLPQVIKDIKE